MPASKNPSSSVNLKTPCPSPQTQAEAQASRLLQRPFSFELQKIVRRMYLIMKIQQVEDVFSIACKNLRVCLNVLDLEQTT